MTDTRNAELQAGVTRAMESIEAALTDLATLGSQVEPRRGFEILLRFDADGRRSCQIRPVAPAGGDAVARRSLRR